MDFKKKHDYILKNKVDITIYDRLRELIKEFGDEPLYHGYVSNRCKDERMFHINNQKNIDEEIEAMDYIVDDIRHDLLHAISRRIEKLHKIREYTEDKVIINGEIYIRKFENYNKSYYFSTEEKERSFFAKAFSSSIDSKEVFFKLTLCKRSEECGFSSDSITLGNEFTYDEANKIMRCYVIDKKFTFDKDYCETEEGKRDLSIKILLDILK